ncbi:2-(5''-triphosphoribosyl)-3'-dephosphocoenzyme-A synthase [Yersinia frederiksenii]|nr:2-(5''-triphosphoribosyl)-3'-dephosphocoenzyme-A synthase [Yersinia frederiksenii]
MASDDNNVLWIGEILLKSILMEVCSWPKPGLVTPISCGAHKDMDVWLFISSSAAIAPCFTACANAGKLHQGELSNLLPVVREIGQHYEAYLLSTTHQVNTQRGVLFSGSILAATVGWMTGKAIPLSYPLISQTVAELCQGLCARDFAQVQYKNTLTHGEKLYIKYGVTGIRGEAESGFSLVCNTGMPALHQALNDKLPWREALLHTLMALISRCEDTTVLARGGQNELQALQMRASSFMNAGGMFQAQALTRLDELNHWCIERNISPGGSADLLSLCLAMYFFCQPK